MRTPWLLIGRHLREHWVRSGLTMLALTVAMFLFCFLISLVTTLERVVTDSATNRLIPQSAVSLFVSLPLDYQPKIESVPGVEAVTKFQWFGGYYQKRENFLAEFGIDYERFFDMYRKELQITEALDAAALSGDGGAATSGDNETATSGDDGTATSGDDGTATSGDDGTATAGDGGTATAGDGARAVPLVRGAEAAAAVVAAMSADRRACVVGEGLVRDFGWNVGDTFPLISPFFVKADQSAWDFNVVGVYKPLRSNMDDRTIWFRFDYLDEMLASGEADGPRGVGVFAVNLAPGYEPDAVIADIDALFANGPQRTLTTTEAAFQAGFVSMMGNLPFFVGTIGGAVVFAVVFSVVNTMLMAGRQRLHETGILKALGFRDAALARLMLGESLVLSLLGGGAGIALALWSATGLREGFGPFLPTYAVEQHTALLALLVTLGIGLVAGIAPAVLAARLRPTAALRSEG